MKRRYLILGGVLLLAAVMGVWQVGYHGVDPRLIFRPPPTELPPPEALDESAELDVVDVPLSKVLDELAERHGVPLEIDSSTKLSGLVTGAEPVSMRLADLSLRSLLSHLAREFDLVVRAREGIVYLTTEDDWANNLSNYAPRVFTLEKLLASPHSFDEVELVDLVTILIAQSRWESAGGNGVCTPLPGGLVISQTPELQDEVARLLDRLAEVESGPPTTESIALERPTKRTETVIAALKQPVDIDCQGTPLAKVVELLSQTHGVPIQLHTRALEGVGISADTPVDCHLKDISLDSALRHLLRPLELTIIVRDEAINITTPEIADNTLAIRLYPVADLLDRRKQIDMDSLIDTITMNIGALDWADRGGAGEIQAFGGQLVVLQTRDVHEQMEKLLANVRHAMRPETPADPRFQPTPALARLERALAGNVSIQFDEAPLTEVVAWLREDQKIAIQLDLRALDGMAISPDLPLSFKTREVPLEWALCWMLEPVGLVPMVRGESLVITTPEVGDNALETRCYRLRRASPPPAKLAKYYVGRATVADFEPVVDTITTIIASPTWEDAGGAGSIMAIGNVLVVSQTRAVHETVHDLLAKLEDLEHSASPAAPVWVGEHAAPWCGQIDAALAKRTNLEFENVALSKVLERMSAEHQISFQLDKPNLEPWDNVRLKASVPCFESESAEPRITCNFRDVTLRLGLELMLREHNLAYAVRGGSVVITVPDVANHHVRVRLYDVRDLKPRLTRTGRTPRGIAQHFEPSAEITDIITTLIAPQTWEDAGGSGALFEYEGLLVVGQTAEMHRRLEQFLAVVRKLPASPTELSPIAFDDAPEGRATELEAVFAKRASFKLSETPLALALEHLSRDHKVPLVIDPALSEVALAPPITLARENERLAEALTEFCEQGSVRWRVRDGTIFVSEIDHDDFTTICLYPIPDLLRETGRPSADGERKLPYYLAQLRANARLVADPVTNVFDRPRDRPPEPPAAFEMALNNVLSGRDIDWAYFGNYLAVAVHEREIQRNMERLLARLRMVRSLPESARAIGTSSSGSDSKSMFSVFDLRPLLKRYPVLDERLLEDWVLDQAHDKDFAPHRSLYRPWYGARSYGIWSGLLLVAAESDDRKVIRESLAFLAKLPDGLPHPGDLTRDREKAVAQFGAIIESESDPRKLEYVLWLVGRVEKPAAELVKPLTKRLERTDRLSESRLAASLYIALASYGPLAAEAVPVISAQIEGDFSSPHQTLRAYALAALGPRGVVELCRLATSNPGLAQSISAAIQQSPWKGAALEALLPMLADKEQDHKQVLALLGVLDPQALASRSLLDEWRDKSPDPERRRVGIEAEEVLKTTFGERVKK